MKSEQHKNSGSETKYKHWCSYCSFFFQITRTIMHVSLFVVIHSECCREKF